MLKTLQQFRNYSLRGIRRLKIACSCMRGPYFRWVAPGHFYSPLPDMQEVERRAKYIYPPLTPEVAGLDLQAIEQAALMDEFRRYRNNLPIDRAHNPRARYNHPNGSFLYQDAFTLCAMLRRLKPARFVEVGCGMSSCVVLDTCEALQLRTRLTFIDPYPEYLLGLLRPGDRERFELKAQFIQDVPLEVFSELEAGDVLFIDTSHVSKIGSDVNHIFFQIIPRLKRGVYLHFHDIWYPFEYPQEWLQRGMFWNEAYLLRAMLMFNSSFKIILFNNFVMRCLPDLVNADFPYFRDGPGGSLWLQRV